jgi:GAF domain-containing protein/HAMP domain-containing protein
LLALADRQSRWAIYLSFIFAVLAGSFDWIKPEFQVAAPIELEILMPALVALTACVYAVYFIRNFRWLSLRTQLITVFIVVSSLSVAAVTFFSNLYNQRNLTYEANIRLYNSGSQISRTLDEFLKSKLAKVQAQSQLPDIVDYLRLEADQRTGSWQQVRANRTLTSLVLEEPEYVSSYALLDNQGMNIADSSVALIGQDESPGDYFKQIVATGDPYISSVQFSENINEAAIYFSAPIYDSNGELRGVLRARYLTRALDDIVKQSTLLAGSGASAFLIDDNGIRISHAGQPGLVFKSIVPLSSEVIRQLKAEKRLPDWPDEQLSTNLPGLKAAVDRSSKLPFFIAEMERKAPGGSGNTITEQGAIVEMRSKPWKVVFTIDQATFLAPIEAQTRNTTLLGLLIAGLAAIGGLVMAQMLARPISRLTEVAKQVAAGNMSAQAPVEASNELGTLAKAFNAMTSQLLITLEGLEQRIADRTQELERTASQLRAASEVGGTIASIRVLDELLPRVTQLISQRFGFYHVGIFLVDPSGEYAVLRAANSEGGQTMLQRGHQLKVGEVGIVGYVTGKNEPRIAMDVGQDAVYFNNPDLPETRSEMALPLVVGERVLGALDVQSTEPGAFTNEDIATLQLLADQVAIAIDNARLFSENQAALEATQRAYGELSREAWSKLLKDQPNLSVLANRFDILYAASDKWTPEMLQAAQSRDIIRVNQETVAIPIKERENVLGVLNLRKPDGHPWSKEEIGLAETLAQQLYLALENARLYSETQRRAERERLAGNIVAKMRLSNDPHEILRTAVQELRQALQLQWEKQSRLEPAPFEDQPDNGKPAVE